MPDHVHVEDSGFVQALDDVDWGHANGGDEEFCTGVNDYGDEFVKFPFRVVVAGSDPRQQLRCECTYIEL